MWCGTCVLYVWYIYGVCVCVICVVSRVCCVWCGCMCVVRVVYLWVCVCVCVCEMGTFFLKIYLAFKYTMLHLKNNFIKVPKILYVYI